MGFAPDTPRRFWRRASSSWKGRVTGGVTLRWWWLKCFPRRASFCPSSRLHAAAAAVDCFSSCLLDYQDVLFKNVAVCPPEELRVVECCLTVSLVEEKAPGVLSSDDCY